MKCPHCNIGIRLEIDNLATYPLKQTSGDKRIGIELSHGFCPECNELIVLLKRGEYTFVEGEHGEHLKYAMSINTIQTKARFK